MSIFRNVSLRLPYRCAHKKQQCIHRSRCVHGLYTVGVNRRVSRKSWRFTDRSAGPDERGDDDGGGGGGGGELTSRDFHSSVDGPFTQADDGRRRRYNWVSNERTINLAPPASPSARSLRTVEASTNLPDVAGAERTGAGFAAVLIRPSLGISACGVRVYVVDRFSAGPVHLYTRENAVRKHLSSRAINSPTRFLCSSPTNPLSRLLYFFFRLVFEFVTSGIDNATPRPCAVRGHTPSVPSRRTHP